MIFDEFAIFKKYITKIYESSQIKFDDQIFKNNGHFLYPFCLRKKKLRILANPMGLEVKRLFYFFWAKKKFNIIRLHATEMIPNATPTQHMNRKKQGVFSPKNGFFMISYVAWSRNKVTLFRFHATYEIHGGNFFPHTTRKK